MPYTPAETANLALVRAVYDHVLIPFDASRVDDFISPTYIQHSPLAADGPEALKGFLKWAKETSPRAEHRVKRMFADGDHVVAHVHVILEPGDAGFAVVDMFRIADGKLAEHWDVIQNVPTDSPNPNGMF